MKIIALLKSFPFNIKIILPLFFLTGTLITAYPQETNSHVSGIIKSEKNELLAGAVVKVIHQPTENQYINISRSDGSFNFFNLKPGGPYSVTISFTGYETITKKNLSLGFNSSNYFFELSNDEVIEFILQEKQTLLKEVIVQAPLKTQSKSGIETSIFSQQLASLPTISRNLQDFIRLVPQSKVNGDGMMSLAGQNSKFNAFFIDGANNNDILGIAQSGTNGGQTATPPISIEALEEIKVLLAPYNTEYSNFTGGSINAITKSGSNELKNSVWYYFRNENMAGKSPLLIENPASPGTFSRPKFSPFFNQTLGTWVSGPIVKNKLFFFISIEKQLEERPQVFNFSEYRGASNAGQILALADTLRKRYNYDPGTFLETTEKVNAIRTVFKADWNPSLKDKFTVSYRYNLPERTSPRATGSTVLGFQNNGFIVPARTHSVSAEWKHFFKKGTSNRFLFTYTNQKDDRQILGKPFPQVLINDGAGSIFFGSNGSSQLSLFKGKDITLLDVFKFIKNKHNFSIGADLNFSKINDLFVNPYFGGYQYRSLSDFLSNQFPSRYTRRFPLTDAPKDDNTTAGATYQTQRFGFFINDEMYVNKNLKLNFGIRIDGNMIPGKYEADKFFNDTASKIIATYYKLDGATSGTMMKSHWQVAPRFGFTYKIPGKKITINGGAGLFTGRILNIWASAIYNSSLGNIDINPQQYSIRFIADPYGQPTYQTLGLNAATAKGEMTIISEKFKYPVVFRSNLSGEKKFSDGWTLTTEAMFTQNIHEWKITNINILPPSKLSAAPDSRFIYSLNTIPEFIPVRPNGTNPYTGIYLLSNNKNKKGYSYSLALGADKLFSKNFSIAAGYTYGASFALFEPYGTAGPIANQWNGSETVNGKNFTSLSVSDLDPGHRFYINAFKKLECMKHKMSTSFSLFYNGQSGQPYSYVYAGSMTNDNGRQANYDLIYIPMKSDLNAMTFIPITVNNITYTEAQQKEQFDNFITNDKYLRKHRGQFAERNGARLPFTHTIDIRIQQDFTIKLNKKSTKFSIIYDVFNFTNMLNRKWGHIYFLSSGNYPLLRFAGFSNITTLTPQYQFTPFNGKPYSLHTSTAPGNSVRWISQLGFRITF